MKKSDKIIMAIGILTIFLFVLVAGYCGIYISETRKEDDRRAKRIAEQNERYQQIIDEYQPVISNERPRIYIVND